MTAEKLPALSVVLAFHATALLPLALVLGLKPQALLQHVASLDSFRAKLPLLLSYCTYTHT